MLLDLFLKECGYRVSFASDGMSCLATAQRERPDLIILDLGLPAGGGLTALERMRSVIHLSETPVLVLTAREASECQERAFQLGANSFLQKPIGKDPLLAEVRRLLGDDGASGAQAPGWDGLHCPHCGGTLGALGSSLDPAALAALLAETLKKTA